MDGFLKEAVELFTSVFSLRFVQGVFDFKPARPLNHVLLDIETMKIKEILARVL
jgi:hypothetical protein